MKRFFRFLLSFILAVAILGCTAWFFLIYDTSLTQDILLESARRCEAQGNHTIAAWLYQVAYSQSGDNDAVAIELAMQYKASGNYTKTEFTLSNAIADGGGVELYMALCKTYVEQDKLLDAVKMLDSISNPEIKAQLDAMRPVMPTASHTPGFYSEYISVSLDAGGTPIYVTTDGEYPSVAQPAYTAPLELAAGENTIFAVSVSENGLVSPAAIFGYTIGGIIEEVTFADSAFEEEIHKLLELDADVPVYTNDLWEITSFTVPEGAKNYEDLKYLPYLETLVIYRGQNNQLQHIAPLQALTELAIIETLVTQEQLSTIAALPLLQTLTLRQCNLSSVSPLENATGLVYLDLGSNAIRNVAPLSNLKKLTTLYLQHNALDDLSDLSMLPSLSKLDVSYNSLDELSPIFANPALAWINAEENQITGISGIARLPGLTYLDLSNNRLTSCASLLTCVKLNHLDLSNNALTNIQPLNNAHALQYLDFSHNEVTALPEWEKDCELVTINGSHNLLTDLTPLGGLENLNTVTMDYNADITDVSCLADCPVLIRLDIFGTQVADVSSLTDQNIIVNYNPVLIHTDEEADEEE